MSRWSYDRPLTPHENERCIMDDRDFYERDKDEWREKARVLEDKLVEVNKELSKLKGRAKARVKQVKELMARLEKVIY